MIGVSLVLFFGTLCQDNHQYLKKHKALLTTSQQCFFDSPSQDNWLILSQKKGNYWTYHFPKLTRLHDLIMAVASICPHADKLTKEYTHEIADGARLMLFLALRFML